MLAVIGTIKRSVQSSNFHAVNSAEHRTDTCTYNPAINGTIKRSVQSTNFHAVNSAEHRTDMCAYNASY